MSNTTIEEKFWDKIQITEDGCWRWTAAHHESGCGLLNVPNKPTWIVRGLTPTLIPPSSPQTTWKAHRFAWTLLNGPIPTDKIVARLHSCPHKDCVNPEHLFLKTRKPPTPTDGPGLYNEMIRLTDGEVFEMRSKHSDSEMPAAAIAQWFGYSEQLVTAVIERKIWDHI